MRLIKLRGDKSDLTGKAVVYINADLISAIVPNTQAGSGTMILAGTATIGVPGDIADVVAAIIKQLELDITSDAFREALEKL